MNDFIVHTGIFCAHVVGSVTVVELNFVTLIRPESSGSLEGVLETEDDFPAASLETVEFTLAVRDSLLVDGFSGLDVGFLPDECSAKGTVYCKNVVYVYHERRLVDWRTWLWQRKLYSNSGPKAVSSPILACGASAFIYKLSSASRPL